MRGVYIASRWAKAIDGGPQWLLENGRRAMMNSKCSSFRLSTVTILKGFGLFDFLVGLPPIGPCLAVSSRIGRWAQSRTMGITSLHFIQA
jgi:hypothetical protein